MQQQAAVPAIRMQPCDSAGYPAAFEHLFRAEYARVVGVAYQTVRDRQEAEDVAQEAFIRFHERYPPDASFAAAWLCRTAANIGLTLLRSRKRREHRELDHVRDARYQLVDPVEVLEAKEQRRLVRAALGRIAPKKARVLALRY